MGTMDGEVIMKTIRYSLSIAIVLTAVTATAAPRVKHDFQSTVVRGAVRRVVIDIPAADLTIRNGAADRLALSGTVTREPDSDRSRPEEQSIVNATTVEFYVSKDEAVVRRRFGPDAQSWRASMFSSYSLTLDLPAGVDVDILTTAGDVTLDGTFGDLDIDLRAGNVKVRMPKKVVRELTASARVGEVRTRIGDEVIQREGVFPGKTRYSNPAGKAILNVHVTAGEVDVELTP